MMPLYSSRSMLCSRRMLVAKWKVHAESVLVVTGLSAYTANARVTIPARSAYSWATLDLPPRRVVSDRRIRSDRKVFLDNRLELPKGGLRNRVAPGDQGVCQGIATVAGPLRPQQDQEV